MARIIQDTSESIDSGTGLIAALQGALTKALEVAGATIPAQINANQVRPFEIIQRLREESGAIFTLSLRYSPPVKSTPPKDALTFSFMEEVRRVFDCQPYGATFAQIEAITCLPVAVIEKLLGLMMESGEVVKFTSGGKELFKYTNREVKR